MLICCWKNGLTSPERQRRGTKNLALTSPERQRRDTKNPSLALRACQRKQRNFPPSPSSAWPPTSALGNRSALTSNVFLVVTTRCHQLRHRTGGACRIALGSASKDSTPIPSPVTTSIPK